MTPNLIHVAGLELASEAVKDCTSPEAIQGAIYRLLNQAKSAPPSHDAELVRQCIAEELSTWEGDFQGPVQTAMRCLQVRIDAKLASLKP
ncbi:hypothetical protein [uncultured Pseudomonas sp.]|uniref:hypothetical protein n=1 Tax=uncultured Pseudomonas sp. TaxID=114707 RepID=UPI0026338AC7|nr:hypothetical protein [uncultured Pseudomonas sp.]